LKNNRQLLTNIIQIFPNIICTKNKSKKQKVCFSGKFPYQKKIYEQMAQNNGCEIKTTVTKDLNLLVVNDLKNLSTKQQKAINLGVNIVDLKTFLHFIKEE